MGGSVFVVGGGSLTFQGSFGSMFGGALTGGMGGSASAGNGQTFGNGIFLNSSINGATMNGTLIFEPDAGATFTYNDDITDQTGSGGTGPNAGSGGLTLGVVGKTAGIVLLGGNNTFSGATTINSGTLQGNLSPNSTLTLSNGTTYNLSGNQTSGGLAGEGTVSLGANTLSTGGNNTDSEFSGIIEGVGSLTKTGTGNFTLSGKNTYAGGTIISEGNVSISSDSNLGDASGVLTLNGGVLETTATLSSSRNVVLGTLGGEFQVDQEGTTTTLSGKIGGVGALTKINPGTLKFASLNTYSGGTVIKGGILNIDADSNLGDPSGVLTLNGGILETTETITCARTITLGKDGGTFQVDSGGDTTFLTGNISGEGSLTKTGSGSLQFYGTNNTYTGSTNILEGNLSVEGTIPTRTSLSLSSSASFSILQGSQEIGSLSGSDGSNVYLNDFSLTTGGNNTSTSCQSIIFGSGALTKIGTGTFILNAANNYTGGTAVNGGVLSINQIII